MKRIFLMLAAFLGTVSAWAQNDSIAQDYNLEEVVVAATKPLTKLDYEGIITTVEGTPLQKLETVNDLLGYIPGVTNQNGSIEVVGKGQPVIYLNGRKLRSLTVLGQLPAANVKDVKVIQNPGARYSGDVNSVIRISTVKELGDGFALDARAAAGVRQYLYTKDVLGINYRQRGLDLFADVEYDKSKNNRSRTNEQNFWGAHERTSTSTATSIQHDQMLDCKIGLDYAATSKHQLGAYYQHTHHPTRTSTSGNTSYYVYDGMTPTESEVKRPIREKDFGDLIDAYYSGAWDKWTIDATFDFLWKDNHSDQHNRETVANLAPIDFTLRDRSKGRMAAGELHISRPIGKGDVQFGAEYTDTRRTDNFVSDAAAIASLDDKISENNLGVYGQISQTFGPLMVQAGLRYEHTRSDYYALGIRQPEQSKSYDELLPSVSMMLPVKRAMFQLSYARKYNRPFYEQLSSTVYYVDPYTYETGNPNLRNTFTDNLSLNVRYQWLMFMASYKHIDNRIITACTGYPTNPDVALLRKENARNDTRNVEVIASASPGFIGKIYYPIAMVGVVSQFYDQNFQGGVKHMNQPMVLVRWNNIFQLPKEFIVYANLNYRSRCDGENIHMNSSTWQLDLSLAKMLNKHWDARLTCNDIFNTARKTEMTMYCEMYALHSIKQNTVRNLELSIGYKFNTTKSKYRGKGAGNEEKERLGL
jgi:outer membrane receptor protein involved in Fe transport